MAQLISADWASYTLSTESMTEFTQELTGFDMSALVGGRWQKQPLWRSVRVDFGPPHTSMVWYPTQLACCMT